MSIVLTKKNTSTFGSTKFTGGAISLSVPTSGSTKGIVFFADPTMP